ncbi:hypothetical protein N7495_003305 [Penicillium taxi]|uniref:uncharacterized protein n=1 Tax=Penicillium taxi TaxID=168475 RepID=UPI0025457AE2|nr:uncharacterized protein N7495_003305 [Penicillium taxi]KAJ5902777.1 hypothetical protein N7495_003305 [Penicillium taxi]
MQPSFHPTPTILFPKLPPNILVGIDLITLTSAPKFYGIRDLPTGWHLVYTGTTESLSLRCGAWFHVNDTGAASDDENSTALVAAPNLTTQPEIFIWKWNSDTESLTSLLNRNEDDRRESMQYKANLGAIRRMGGLFRYQSCVPPSMLAHKPDLTKPAPTPTKEDEEVEKIARTEWLNLTSYISSSLLSRIIGSPEVNGDDHCRWLVTTASSADRDSDHIPGLSIPTAGSGGSPWAVGELERGLDFLPVDLKRTWREGAIGSERTEGAQDKSWALGDLIQRYSSSSSNGTAVDQRSGEVQLLGELQFTFLTVLTLMNYSCLQQWKRLLELILTSREAIVTREAFMSDVVSLLLRQLKRCGDVEGGIFDIDRDDGGQFVHNLLIRFKRLVDQVLPDNTESKVKMEFAKLHAWVNEEYDWELTPAAIVKKGMVRLEDGEEVELDLDDNDEYEETGEYAPMIVEI